MCSRFFVRLSKNSAGILPYVKEFLGEMTEKMQTDDVLSRQAVFVRCCHNAPKLHALGEINKTGKHSFYRV